MTKNRKTALITIFISTAIFITVQTDALFAAVTGECSNCHTMHNSQGGAPMATYGASGQPWQGNGPYPLLTRGDCLGCHGMGTGNNIELLGACETPQVFHTNTGAPLAGGNFAYITGTAGGGASDAKGHNVIDIGNLDDVHTNAPGMGSIHGPTNDNLTCAGSNGCHGLRVGSIGSGFPGLKGAHHSNVDGTCDVADTFGNSYRFLMGVRGLENPVDRWQNVDSASHNEYYGESTPSELLAGPGCTTGSCHCGPGMSVEPPNNTISAFCGTCHGDFHSPSGIGGDTTSPFTRHPTDIVIKDEGEYAVANRDYNALAPMGRSTLPIPDSPITDATTEDVVTCLSCHGAHATDYPDLLKWNYDTMDAGNSAGNTNGCFACHTTKDGS